MTIPWIEMTQIVFADLILSGDNALVIGMAAAGLAPKQRKQVIFVGMALAALFRILFAGAFGERFKHLLHPMMVLLSWIIQMPLQRVWAMP